MLDVLRKHASSWLIKVILGAIIVSFAFFFGYNRMTRARQTVKGLIPGQPVATVNGVEISDTEFQFFFDRNLDRLRETFKGEGMAESLRKFTQQMTLQQLIERELLIQTAQGMGIRITDAQLAATIRKNPELIKDGEFDPIFYRHQYLPYFENRFGINYEELIRQDMKIDALQRLFEGADSKATAENESTLWTFEVATLTKSKDGEDAQSLAQSFISSPKDWKVPAQKTKAIVKTVGPISIAERSKILDGRGTFGDYQNIFALNTTHPVINKPIESGDALYVVRFVEKKSSPVKASQERGDNFLAGWMNGQMKTAKIVTYLEPGK